MKILFIYPSMNGKQINNKYISWLMEPLVYAILKALTPSNIITEFIDERFEPITKNDTPDLVVMSIRTFNANRAYELSKQFIEKVAK